MESRKTRSPVLESDRLVLRPLQPRDQDSMISILTNDEVTQTYMVPDFASYQEAAALFQKLMDYCHRPDAVGYAICLKETDSLIGFLNDCEFDRESLAYELGYVIHPAHQGKGYATEALQAVIRELFQIGIRAVRACHFEENPASRRVMEKCGMSATGVVTEVPYRGTVHKARCMETQNIQKAHPHSGTDASRERQTMELTIRDLQDYLHLLYKKYNDDQGLFMKLIEEIGEVAEVMNQRTGRKAWDGEDSTAALAEELADVLHYAVAIAAVNGIDLSEVIFQKDQKASLKYHRDINLKDFVQKSGK